MSRRRHVPWGHLWPATLDPLARDPGLGATIGLLLVVLLVPVLSFFRGANGLLGQSIPLFFIVPVVLSAVLGGRLVGVLISCVAIMAWDWYFIPPVHTVTVASVRDLLALVVFVLVALLVGQLATAARRRAEEAHRQARSSEALYDLSLSLITQVDFAEVLNTITRRIRATFDLEACAVLLPDERGGWQTAAVAGDLRRELRAESSRNVASTASWVNAQGQTTALGRLGGTVTRAGRVVRPRAGEEQARFLPLRVGPKPVGVLELVRKGRTERTAEQERLLATFANGIALALEQRRLGEEERAAAVARESDRLKSALLSSVSHDLRTPLAAIKAAASSLLQADVQWEEADRLGFATDINDEADRLTRLVSNLLDLSRIEAGALTPALEWEDVGELMDRVLRRLGPRLAAHPVRRRVQAPLPQVRLDAMQIEQVLTNLIENAAKYAPPGSPITIGASLTRDGAGREVLAISVADQGPGIAPEMQGRIFDKFYRVMGAAGWAMGTGLGLAIVKGLAEAHGGEARVESTPGKGSTFTVTLPLAGSIPGSATAEAGALERGEPAVR